METNVKQKGREEELTGTEHLPLQARPNGSKQQPDDIGVTFSEL